ncbi:MAG: hypothetical protein EYC62_03885 [Alphaproteobacteria bacterium]|nr:MAG: hypothetical protein EYC62_03885 [Alphaproteobacteria bacterium]
MKKFKLCLVGTLIGVNFILGCATKNAPSLDQEAQPAQPSRELKPNSPPFKYNPRQPLRGTRRIYALSKTSRGKIL